MMEVEEKLAELMAKEEAAYAALMNDPKVLADPKSKHDPELLWAWMAAAEEEQLFRNQNGL